MINSNKSWTENTRQSSSKFWKKFKGNKKTGIRTLNFGSGLYVTPEEKANLFAAQLRETFSDQEANPRHDNQFKSIITEEIKTFNEMNY